MVICKPTCILKLTLHKCVVSVWCRILMGTPDDCNQIQHIIMTWMWIVCSDWFRSIVYYAAFLPALNTAPKRWCTEKYSTMITGATY